jgi:hypothetical protein
VNEEQLANLSARLETVEQKLDGLILVCDRLQQGWKSAAQTQEAIRSDQDLTIRRQAELADLVLRALEDFGERLGFSLDAAAEERDASRNRDDG